VCFKITLGAIVLTMVFANAFAAGKPVKMKDLPPAVQRTVQEQSKGATLRGLSTEVEHGKTIYEVEMTVNGHGKDVSMDASGTVIEVEEEVALGSIPAAARAAIEKAAAGGKIAKVEKVTGEKEVAYEAALRKDGKRSEVRVSADGSMLPED
jgi:uncharacterized membrane protein YkoI